MDDNYNEIINKKWDRPVSDFQGYAKAAEQAAQDFLKGNKVIDLIDGGKFTMRHYHNLLRAIFHQVYFSSTSFGIAGAMSAYFSVPIRTYLLHHAEEEMNHWIWILEDLEGTGYKGPDPRSELPNWAAQAYMSYGLYLSMFQPAGRLAMASVLEGVSGKFGGAYGLKAIGSLKIKKDHAKFFLMHGELDQGHTHDILTLLEGQSLTPQQWGEMVHIARTTSQLYKNIYNYSVEQD